MLSSSRPITCAVIGVGRLGRFHALKYAAHPLADLRAVVDSDPTQARAVGTELGCTALCRYQELLGNVDAVSIAVPTTLHYQIAKAFLSSGVHVLVEKPLATRVSHADDLIETAHQAGRILQVGHLERFNPAIVELNKVLREPLFVESHRIAPFRTQTTDVNVILDLMIHDIDIIANLVHSDISSISASGACVLSDVTDIANARIEFTNGCIANITASRVGLKTERKIRFFQQDLYVSADLIKKTLKVVKKTTRPHLPSLAELHTEETACEAGDALQAQISAFLDSIANGRAPLVSGKDAKRALEIASHIGRALNTERRLGLIPDADSAPESTECASTRRRSTR